jgi:hypothetical protein
MGRRKTTKESQDGILVPTELPLLPLDGQVNERHDLAMLRFLHRSMPLADLNNGPWVQVLLPTAYARISLSHKSVSR